MVKNEKTIMWILGIAVALLLLVQFADIDVPFAIAGGGAGSSISQVIDGVGMEFYGDTYSICVARPPVGETWLITGFDDTSGDCSMVSGDYMDQNNWYYTLPTTDRLFIDYDSYLLCGDYFGRSCDFLVISGVRV